MNVHLYTFYTVHWHERCLSFTLYVKECNNYRPITWPMKCHKDFTNALSALFSIGYKENKNLAARLRYWPIWLHYDYGNFSKLLILL